VLLACTSAQAQFQSPVLGDGPWDVQTFQAKVHIELVARGLEHPWSIAFLPGGEMLVSERAGRLRRIRNGKLDPEQVSGMPVVQAKALLGFMEVLPHPDFANNSVVYLTYHKEITAEPAAVTFVLAQAHYANGKLSEVKELLVSDTWDGAGGAAARLAFGTDGKLYMGIGATRDASAQNPASLRGKILRLNDDGSVPQDNPFVGKEGYRPEIFTMGHRDPDGLAVHPATGELWAIEHGPMGGDEINIIRKGNNYGWPIITYGKEYDGSELGYSQRKGFEQPRYYWFPSVAPSGMLFYTGSQFPQWQNDLFIGTMSPTQGKFLVHLELDGDKVVSEEHLLVQNDRRVRALAQGIDGALYVLTDSEANDQTNRHFPGEVIKLTPQ
jgi:glucose/arabinose dehydrogenase